VKEVDLHWLRFLTYLITFSEVTLHYRVEQEGSCEYSNLLFNAANLEVSVLVLFFVSLCHCMLMYFTTGMTMMYNF
jgi:hypothetical protein